ncbi:MAG: prepilin-type N-terminal cleavage/methylation domain-containing protein [bacterium]|nr:prepilin-type N-terminal cleavage/methylation domain-containing protein [bacterium]
MTPYHFFHERELNLKNGANLMQKSQRCSSHDSIRKSGKGGFTLVETLVAISLLTIAIVAPMTLTTQSLGSAYYARDQITAFHIAQEAIESVRHARDRNVLKNALGTTVNLLDGFPALNGDPFTVDTTNGDAMELCSGTCQALRKSNEGLYGYNPAWNKTYFTRTVNATFVPESNNDEVNVSVTVSWQTGSFNSRSFTISDNLFRWVNDGSASQ